MFSSFLFASLPFFGYAFGLFFIICLAAGSSAGKLSSEFPLQFRLAAALRTPILVFVVVPLSFLQWAYLEVRGMIRRHFRAAGSHEDRVARVVEAMKSWNDAGRPRRIRTARANWQQMSTKLGSTKEGCHLVPVRCLDHVLDVDLERMVVRTEPGVTMGELLAVLIPKGCALTVHVEMESITVGGAAMGMGMETNSHASGFFQETVQSYEIVDAQGTVREVTAQSDPTLFRALPWSHGTLGLLTALTVSIVRVKPYVRVRYIPTRTAAELGRVMQELAEAETPDEVAAYGMSCPPHFLEATVYTKDQAVVQCGWYADEAEASAGQVNCINWWWKPFYFRHVEGFLKNKPRVRDIQDGATPHVYEEYIPLRHYMTRFTRSIFWEIEEMIPFSNNPIYRALWGWLGAPEVSLLKLFQGPVIRKASIYAHVVQESIMPVRSLPEGIERFHGWFGVYPLLVFPLRVFDRGDASGFLHPKPDACKPGRNWGIFVDLGAYGAPRKVKEGIPWDPKTEIRRMEHWTRSIGGWQAPYTDLFCTRKEFREMFDHSLWDECRERLRASDAFPEIYDKVKSEEGLIDLADVQAKEKDA